MSCSSSSRRRTRRSDTAARLLLLTGSLLLCGIVAELGLRQWQAQSRAELGAVGVIHRASEDPELVYELKPGARTRRDGIAIEINADGFRDDPFPGPRRAGEYRVVAVGDSVTAGWAVAMPEAWPQRLEALLSKQPPGGAKRVTVLNLGVYGYATRQELRLLETRGLAYQPDLVILLYHLNDPDAADAGQLRSFRRPTSYLLHWLRGLRLAPDEREYHSRIHEDHADEIAADFRRLGELSRNSGVPVLVAVLPVFEWEPGPDGGYAWADLHRGLERLAGQNGLDFLDLAPRLTAESAASVSNGIWHPNAHGQALIADELRRWVQASGR